MKVVSRLLIPVLVFLFSQPLFASEGSGNDLVHKMMLLIFQLAVIVFFAKAFGSLFEKLSMPSVLGELIAGVVIGPYLLGSIAIPGFEHGLFPLLAGATVPVSPELYGVATLASILLLFLAGLETDIEMFLSYSLAGSVVGIAGIFSSFLVGAFTGVIFLDVPFMSPTALFLGVMSTATSVGITARILSERRKMDSPEGVTILAGAVIDDVLGIILLAVSLGIASVMMSGAHEEIHWGHIALIAFKAVGVWLGFTILGLIFAHKISSNLKKLENKHSITVVAFGLALLLAGIFEQAGLAMIVGAYVMGLSLSKTELSYIIQEELHPLQTFLVPIFFAVMGMLVDLRVFASKEILIFGLVYSVGAVVAKYVGCGIPALFLGFNKLGASRIGLGMIPRGEVALIIAGIGLANGILDQKVFGVSIMMTLITTVVAPPLLDISLKKPQKGTVKDPITGNTETSEFKFNSHIVTEALVGHIRDYFSKEGFFIYMMKVDYDAYQIRKDDIIIKMNHYPEKIEFVTSKEDVSLIKTILYEAFVQLYYRVERISKDALPEEMRQIISKPETCRDCVNFGSILDPDCIKRELESDTKEGVVRELVSLLDKKGLVYDYESVVKEVLERESVISTGMENGFACPHARSGSFDHVQIAVGIKKSGLDFDSMDKKPAKVIVLLLSSTKDNDPHIQVLASLSSMFVNNGGMEKLLAAKNNREIWDVFNAYSAKRTVRV